MYSSIVLAVERVSAIGPPSNIDSACAMPPHRPPIAALLALVFATAACSAASTPGSSASATPVATPTATPTQKPLIAPRPTDMPFDGTCERDQVCLGLLKPGATYRTKNFQPAFSFGVQTSQWENIALEAKVVQLLDTTHPGDLIAFFRHARAADDDGTVAAVGSSVNDVTAWLEKELVDPKSAIIKWLGEPKPAELAGDNGEKITGYLVEFSVNARNRFGAYTGAQKHGALIRDGKVLRATGGYGYH